MGTLRMAEFTIRHADGEALVDLADWLRAHDVGGAIESSGPPTLSAAEVTAVLVSSAGALTALITALSAYARARSTTIVLHAPSGTSIAISGPLSRETVDDFVAHLTPGDTT